MKLKLPLYTGNALKTFDRIHTGHAYSTNKLYRSPEGLIYYINQKGYLHVYKAEKRTTPNKSIKLYCLVDYRLNTDNTLTESCINEYINPEHFKEASEELEANAISLSAN